MLEINILYLIILYLISYIILYIYVQLNINIKQWVLNNGETYIKI